MAKTRMINTRFWSDGFIVSLDALDRYLFLYFLTNEHTNICGIYELPLRTAINELNITQQQFVKSLKKLEGKIFYIEGWIYVKNFEKYQTYNENVKKGIETAKKEIPKNIMDKIAKIPISKTDGIPMVTQPYTNPPSYLNSNLNLNINNNITSVPDESSFTQFWTAYPKKEDKKKCLEIWKRKKYETELKKILDFILKAKETDRWKKGYIKLPLTFLRGECWNDDLESYNEKNSEGLTITKFS